MDWGRGFMQYLDPTHAQMKLHLLAWTGPQRVVDHYWSTAYGLGTPALEPHI